MDTKKLFVILLFKHVFRMIENVYKFKIILNVFLEALNMSNHLNMFS